MTNRKFITLQPEEHAELSKLLDNINAKKDLVDDLAIKIFKEKNILWNTIHDLYPELEDREANYHRKLGKISYDTDDLDDIAKVSQNIEQLILLRKLRKSGKINNELMIDIMEVLQDE